MASAPRDEPHDPTLPPPGDAVDREQAILAARARALARCEHPESPHAVSVLTFTAGEERFALELERVLRVERVDRVIRVPTGARGVVGLFNLHGRPCALLDVPALLAATVQPQARRWGVVLGARHAEVALAADEVEAARIERPGGTRRPYQLGVTADARVLLDADALLMTPGADVSHGGAR